MGIGVWARAVLAVVLAVGVAGATNIATDVLPASWQPYRWVAWPALGVLLLAAVAVEVLQRRRGRVGKVREEVASGVRSAGSGSAGPVKAQPVVPRQLPAGLRHFAGRAAEARVLDDLSSQAAGAGTVVISAIGGTAGIGKTALAVWWAHRAAEKFPDGQLYVNLRGFDPSGAVVSPGEAVRGFLDAFEVPPERIPKDLDAQAALYRSLVAGKRVLIVLDNARDADQVRALLPGSPGCVVVVTSRNQLSSLVAEGARPLPLDLLTHDEARQLLTQRIGHDRVAAEPEALEEIITRCARLPLALAIVAARAAARPRFPLQVIATELREARDRLDALDGGDSASDVRAVFS